MSLRQEADQKLLSPIYETVRRVKSELGPKTTLIGFCGAPWTVATYMVAGQGTPDQAPAKNSGGAGARGFSTCHRLPGRCFGRVSGAAIGSRRRRGADIRYLGRLAAAAGFRALVRAADQTSDRKTAGETSRHQSDRVSPRRRQEYSALCDGDRRRCGQPGKRYRPEVCPRANPKPRAGAGQCRSVDLARRRRRARPRSRRRARRLFRTGRSSSISATAFCPTRRSRMWSRCSSAYAVRPMYLWLKALHIIAVISWMAGMLYLPRLFVYHCDAEPGSKQSETFKVMERRLLKAIIDAGDDRRPGSRNRAGRLRAAMARCAWFRIKFVLVFGMIRRARLSWSTGSRNSPPTATSISSKILSYYQRDTDYLMIAIVLLVTSSHSD